MRTLNFFLEWVGYTLLTLAVIIGVFLILAAYCEIEANLWLWLHNRNKEKDNGSKTRK